MLPSIAVSDCKYALALPPGQDGGVDAERAAPEHATSRSALPEASPGLEIIRSVDVEGGFRARDRERVVIGEQGLRPMVAAQLAQGSEVARCEERWRPDGP